MAMSCGRHRECVKKLLIDGVSLIQTASRKGTSGIKCDVLFASWRHRSKAFSILNVRVATLEQEDDGEPLFDLDMFTINFSFHALNIFVTWLTLTRSKKLADEEGRRRPYEGTVLSLTTRTCSTCSLCLVYFTSIMEFEFNFFKKLQAMKMSETLLFPLVDHDDPCTTWT